MNIGLAELAIIACGGLLLLGLVGGGLLLAARKKP